MGTVFCFQWLRTENLKGKIRAASGKVQSGPKLLSEERETQTQGTLFFLYEKIQSGHIVRKKSAQTSVYIFFFSLTRLRITMEWSSLH